MFVFTFIIIILKIASVFNNLNFELLKKKEASKNKTINKCDMIRINANYKMMMMMIMFGSIVFNIYVYELHNRHVIYNLI